MNVVFTAAEAVPFAKTGGLADVIGALPVALAETGCRVRVILPFYKTVREGDFGFQKILPDVYRKKWTDGVDFYFIDQKAYFDRDGLYGTEEGDYPDNFDRFTFFAKRVLGFLKQQGEKVDVLHCHDWHTALIPLFLKAHYKEDNFFKKTKSVLTIHNLAFQGLFPATYFPKLEIDEEFLSEKGLLFYEKLNFLKGGILTADQVTTVSEEYAREIKTKDFGCGLEKELSSLKKPVLGILNGIDKTIWNPAADPLIFECFDASSFKEAKEENKRHLREQFRLKEDPQRLVLGFVGRISHQKGLDLMIEAVSQLKDFPVQLILQGVGDPDLQKKLRDIRTAYKNWMVYFDGFDESIAHRIYAGSDFFLIPSIFEPCGLSQMIAMRYGTIPIAAPTGGLVDTVKNDQNGILMKKSSAKALVEAVKQAVAIFKAKDKLNQIRRTAMHTHFGWEESAHKYKDLYQWLLSA